MKNIFRKVGLIIMAAAMSIPFVACGKVNTDTADTVCRALQEKYSEEFVATAIGDRWNTGHARLYIHPKDNEQLVFQAVIDRETGVVTDTYVAEKVNSVVKDNMRKAFAQQGITMDLRCIVSSDIPDHPEPGDYTPAEFVQKYGFESYFLILMIKDDGLRAENVVLALENAMKASDAALVVNAFTFDAENYSACVSVLADNPFMTTTAMKKREPKTEFLIRVEDGVCDISADELTEILEK